MTVGVVEGGGREPWRDRSAEHRRDRSAEHPWAVREAALEAYDPAAVGDEGFATEADALEALDDEIVWLAAHEAALVAGEARRAARKKASEAAAGNRPP